MIPATVETVLKNPSDDAVEQLLADEEAVFWVDWREEDDAIVGYCEGVLRTGELSAEAIEVDADPGFELHVSFRSRREKVPLVVGPEDRHLTLRTLNLVLSPDYEVRVCADSNGSDTLAFLPLPAADWATIDARFGEAARRRFRKIEERPNLFTEPW